MDQKPIEPRPSSVVGGTKATLSPGRMAVLEWSFVVALSVIAFALAGVAIMCLVAATRWAF